MKKTICLIILAITIFLLVIQKSNNVVIPREAIRIRVIANSNSNLDQEEKKKVLNNIKMELYELLKDARTIINDNIKRLNISILDSTKENFKLNYGMNYFPKKVYKGIIYEEGEYESLVITLGSGQGDNFWCVLFPPLCLLEGNEDTKDVEYRFFVKDLIDKYKSS